MVRFLSPYSQRLRLIGSSAKHLVVRTVGATVLVLSVQWRPADLTFAGAVG